MDALGSLGIFPANLAAQVFHFLLLFGLLSVLLWRPALQRIEARRKAERDLAVERTRAAEALANADRERERILNEAREEARRLLAEASREAQQMREEILEQARTDARKLLDEAREDAQREKERLLARSRGEIAGLAIAAAQHLLGEALDERRQRALVESFFNGLTQGELPILQQIRPDEADGVTQVIVTSAVPLTGEEQATIHGELVRRLGHEVKLDFRVDPSLLGGLVLNLGTHIVDGSVAAKLEQLRRVMN